MDNYRADKPATQQSLETTLWNEALSTASAQRLLNNTTTYQSERAKLQQEYGASLPKGMTRAALDSLWASAAANARAKLDQASTARALRQYGETKLAKRTQAQPATNSRVTTKAGHAALALVIDHYMAQHGQYLAPGTADYSKEEEKALSDSNGLAAAERTFAQTPISALPPGVQPTDLLDLARAGELDAARKLLPRQTSQAIAALGQSSPASPQAKSSGLEADGFDDEVMNYEIASHLGYAAPGSAQWNTDAQALLSSPSALTAARDAVAVAHTRQLAAHGLNMRQFGAALWAGETVAQARLTQQRDENPPRVCIANAPDIPLSAMERQKQGEWDVLTSLSDALTNLPSSGIDPTLARQTLMANDYVGSLAQQIDKTMQAVAAGKGKTTADAITFLRDTVKSSSIDPQLATVVVSASASTLRGYLQTLSAASADQAAQGFVATAGIYYTMLTAARASAPGAPALAATIKQWSYTAANSTNSTITVGRFGVSRSPLAQMLQQVLTTAQQQKVPPNLFHDWVVLAQTPGKLAAVNHGLQQNATAWATFQQSLQTDRQLATRTLPPNTPLSVRSSRQTPDQVHATYDQALMGLEQNGGLPSTIDPAAAAAAQTMMAPGYVAADQPALARAMIAGRSEQLDAAWLQQHAGEGLTMPVDFFTTQAANQVTGLGMVSARAVQRAPRGMEAPLPAAPSSAAIARTSSAFAALERAQASGNKHAIGAAQQDMNRATANELLSVYRGQFPGNALLTNDENSDWRILAEEQVARDHADNPQLASRLPALLEAGEITQASIYPSKDRQTVAALDAALALFQHTGSGNAITQAVLNDARVRNLVTRQITAATAGVNAAKPAATLAHEAALIAPYERSDANGPVARAIVDGTVAASVTQRVLANAKVRTAQTHDPLGTAAPLMQAAQASPTLALAVFNDFNLPSGSRQAAGTLRPNQLVQSAGDLNDASQYRNAAIIYAALPDNPQVVGGAAELRQAQIAKATMLAAIARQLGKPNDVAAQNLGSWIRASFDGPNSAPDWLAQDLVDGYRDRHVQIPQRLVSTINTALYQSSGSGGTRSATPPSPDFVGRQNAAGLTLQQFTSDDALASYVAGASGYAPRRDRAPARPTI